jgi:hypothetical protein
MLIREATCSEYGFMLTQLGQLLSSLFLQIRILPLWQCTFRRASSRSIQSFGYDILCTWKIRLKWAPVITARDSLTRSTPFFSADEWRRVGEMFPCHFHSPFPAKDVVIAPLNIVASGDRVEIQGLSLGCISCQYCTATSLRVFVRNILGIVHTVPIKSNPEPKSKKEGQYKSLDFELFNLIEVLISLLGINKFMEKVLSQMYLPQPKLQEVIKKSVTNREEAEGN